MHGDRDGIVGGEHMFEAARLDVIRHVETRNVNHAQSRQRRRHLRPAVVDIEITAHRHLERISIGRGEIPFVRCIAQGVENA